MKSSNLYARIEPNVKEQAEAILSELGITASTAINMFYKQIILQEGLPFDVKLNSRPLDVSKITEEELNLELEKGYQDVINDKTLSARDVFANLHKEYNI